LDANINRLCCFNLVVLNVLLLNCRLELIRIAYVLSTGLEFVYVLLHRIQNLSVLLSCKYRPLLGLTMIQCDTTVPWVSVSMDRLNADFYDSSRSIMSYISSSMSLHRKEKALLFRDAVLSHEEVFRKVFKAYHKLIEFGFNKGDVLAIYAEKSDSVVVVILACLMLGICYIPIDRSYPHERVNYILNDAKAKSVVSDIPVAASDFGQIELESLFTDLGEVSIDALCWSDRVRGDDPAYIIYTSGSTGGPKGVVISHSAVNNHMLWMKNEFLFDKSSVFCLRTPISFDPSVWEYLLPFYVGGSLVINDSCETADIKSLLAKIITYGVNVIQFTPIILNQVLSYGTKRCLSSLRFVFSGGETLSTDTKRLFFARTKGCRLINLYGPTEATIDSTFFEVENDESTIDLDIIGRPITNVTFYIADLSTTSRLANKGDPGELYLGGEGLSKGYLNRESESRNSFGANSLSLGRRMYATGDIVRQLDSGNLLYCGRRESLRKINGVRVSVDEIKRFILEKTNSEDCLLKISEDNRLKRRTLSCYIIYPNSPSGFVGELLKTLQSFFPDYMIPKYIRVFDKWVLGPNGKIDLDATQLQLNREVELPILTITQKKLIEIWREFSTDAVIGLDDDISVMGIDSISMFLLVKNISETFKLPFVSGLLSCKTIKEQADFIDNTITNKAPGRCIISLNREARKKIFLIHPIGGTLYWFTRLAKKLCGDIQVYGIFDPEVYSSDLSLDTIESMGAHYCNEIMKIDDSCLDYWIGGASFGSTVAIEVAKNIEKNGGVVKSILSLDGWAVYPESLRDKDYFRNLMARQQKEWLLSSRSIAVHNNSLHDLLPIQRKRLEMLFAYKMQKIPFRVDVFKAKELMPAFRAVEKSDNHWGEYGDNVMIHLVPGNHETMFSKINAIFLADGLRKLLYP